MTNQSFTFDIRYLKSCALVASTEQFRYYLNGVAIQFDGVNLVSIATDGHRLVAFNIDFARECDGTSKPFSMIIPKSVIDGIKTDKTLNNVSLILGTADKKPYLQYGHNMFLFDPIDGVFPDWQRVIPTTISHVVGQFNPKYLMDFQKIINLWDKSKNLGIAHNGEGPALVNLNLCSMEGIGVIMPIRDKETHTITHAPLWATGFRLPTPQEKVAA